ncbi:MAG: hypothetical protein C5B56_03970 [Proteobacteria bacterium]|nr:MAG: hypothetical protein C5B56_03970 [Pseudomonadota bacterium]
MAALDLRYGIGGANLAPKPPFTFRDEDLSGTTAKVKVQDANGRNWVVKFGHEAYADTFGSRIAWAMGYYVEPTYLVADGVVEGAHNLQRAGKDVDRDGHFQGGRFQLRSSEPKYLKTVTWSWDDNPFVGSPELNGLRIVMMLLSDWDNKDARDAESRGSNTAIYQYGDLLYYFIDDWGGAMGNWGKYFTRSKWNASDFARQSADFVSVKNGELHWGYVGQHSALQTKGIGYGDVRWLLQYLDRLSDDQIRTALDASGASPEQAALYVKGLRMRIEALQRLVADRP